MHKWRNQRLQRRHGSGSLIGTKQFKAKNAVPNQRTESKCDWNLSHTSDLPGLDVLFLQADPIGIMPLGLPHVAPDQFPSPMSPGMDVNLKTIWNFNKCGIPVYTENFQMKNPFHM